MNTYDESKHPRGGNPANTGEYSAKANSAPEVELDALTSYVVTTASRNDTLVHGTDLWDAVQRFRVKNSEQILGIAEHGNQGKTLAVAEYQSNHFPLSQLEERGLTLDQVSIELDELIDVPDEDPADLEDVRQWLSDGPNNQVGLVEIVRSLDEPSLADITTTVYENLMWNDMFTEKELDDHFDIVEEVYAEWFNADVYVPDSYDSVQVGLRTDIAVERATPRLVFERTWDSYANYRNETDPGTYGSPYVGHEIRKRIDAAKADREISDATTIALVGARVT